jgi:molybdopterin converting factor small subunit
VGNLGKTNDLESRKISRVTVKAPVRLGDAIHDLEVERSLLLRRDSVLILINGVEANALEDLDTTVNENDQVVLIPMFHGGSPA